MLQSKKIILKGDGNYILTLWGENRTCRGESQPSVKRGTLALLDGQGRMYSGSGDVFPIELDEVAAAVVVEDYGILSKGDVSGRFPWNRLRAELMMKRRSQRAPDLVADSPARQQNSEEIEQESQKEALNLARRPEETPCGDNIQPAVQAERESSLPEIEAFTALKQENLPEIESIAALEQENLPEIEAIMPVEQQDTEIETVNPEPQEDRPEMELITPVTQEPMPDAVPIADIHREQDRQTPLNLYEEMSCSPEPDPEPRECPMQPIVTCVSPFPDEFPESQWRKIEYKGMGSHYLLGDIFSKGSLVATAFAVPAAYSPIMPPWVDKRSRYYMSRNGGGGYWVLLTAR